jgi:hypothetical protein
MTTTTIPAAVVIRTSSLAMRDHTGPPPAATRRRLTFHAATSGDGAAHAVTVPARGTAGDPTLNGAVLDVYDAAGSGERVTVVLPGAGWVPYGDPATPVGYRWTARSRSDPVARVIVRTNRIRVRAGGASWAYTLDEAQQGAIALRLRLGAGTPWCASAPAKTTGSPPSSAPYDHQDRFVAARNTLPAVCPPLP